MAAANHNHSAHANKFFNSLSSDYALDAWPPAALLFSRLVGAKLNPIETPTGDLWRAKYCSDGLAEGRREWTKLRRTHRSMPGGDVMTAERAAHNARSVAASSRVDDAQILPLASHIFTPHSSPSSFSFLKKVTLCLPPHGQPPSLSRDPCGIFIYSPSPSFQTRTKRESKRETDQLSQPALSSILITDRQNCDDHGD